MVYNIAGRNLLFILSVVWNCGSVGLKIQCAFFLLYEQQETYKGKDCSQLIR